MQTRPAIVGLASVGQPERPGFEVVTACVAEQGERGIVGIPVAAVRGDHVVPGANALEERGVDVPHAAVMRQLENVHHEWRAAVGEQPSHFQPSEHVVGPCVPGQEQGPPA